MASKVRGSWLTAAAALLLALAAPSEAREDNSAAHQWLERMISAAQQTSYTGVFVYRQGPEMLESMRIVHRSDNPGIRERLYSLDGVAREIIRDGDRVTCILPDDNSVMVDYRQVRNPLASVLPREPEKIGRHYRLALAEGDRVAGRGAQRLHIHASDPFRYGYRFWIDEITGLMLRAELVHDDEILEQVAFTEVRFPDSIPDEWLEPELSGRDFTWYHADHRDDASLEFEPQWRLEFVPPGFELRMSERRVMAIDADTPVEHRLYSDGMASVSVYVSGVDGKWSGFEGLSRMGAFSVFGRIVGDRQVLVMGEVPPRAVTRMGRSLNFRDGG
ncbi:MucB/RseB C-terminal domain-containing protein [Arhodomonas sp. SL1]|uniref:MucB/RseB C-terminal domain-containing protein n=1 Tax=Arhodomonas sp. SL1 TaxID=3425691 RepID=UPI003F882A35